MREGNGRPWFVNLYDDGTTGAAHGQPWLAHEAYRRERAFYDFGRRRIALIHVRLKDGGK